MVSLSVSAWLMIVLSRFESGRHRGFRNAPHPLSDVLCGLAYALGRQTFCFSLAGCFVVNFTDGVPGSVQTLRCGSLSAPLHRSAGVANPLILDVGPGQRGPDYHVD